jgi:hypothetical protein
MATAETSDTLAAYMSPTVMIMAGGAVVIVWGHLAAVPAMAADGAAAGIRLGTHPAYRAGPMAALVGRTVAAGITDMMEDSSGTLMAAVREFLAHLSLTESVRERAIVLVAWIQCVGKWAFAVGFAVVVGYAISLGTIHAEIWRSIER